MMSRMQTKSAGRRARRRFIPEFKVGAVRLVLDAGKTIGAVARELELTASSLGVWVARANREWRVPLADGRNLNRAWARALAGGCESGAHAIWLLPPLDGAPHVRGIRRIPPVVRRWKDRSARRLW